MTGKLGDRIHLGTPRVVGEAGRASANEHHAALVELEH
jgi:hypothetical protein